MYPPFLQMRISEFSEYVTSPSWPKCFWPDRSGCRMTMLDLLGHMVLSRSHMFHCVLRQAGQSVRIPGMLLVKALLSRLSNNEKQPSFIICGPPLAA